MIFDMTDVALYSQDSKLQDSDHLITKSSPWLFSLIKVTQLMAQRTDTVGLNISVSICFSSF